MPLLDVSDVLLDPMFADKFTVTQRAQTIGTNGRVQVTSTVVNNVGGVICMAGPNDLQRLDDNQRMGRVISVVTKFRLRGPSKDGVIEYQPDIITWDGDLYVVRLVDKYNRYGAGFLEALAGSIKSIDSVTQ